MSNKRASGGAIRGHSVYVIELDRAVLRRRLFREANPWHNPERPCLYVGMTARSPEERYAQHRLGYKAAAVVRRFGRGLRPDLYERFNPMSREDAARMEVELAEKLRMAGFAVWQK